MIFNLKSKFLLKRKGENISTNDRKSLHNKF